MRCSLAEFASFARPFHCSTSSCCENGASNPLKKRNSTSGSPKDASENELAGLCKFDMWGESSSRLAEIQWFDATDCACVSGP